MKEESDALESLKIVSAYTKTLGHSVKELLSVNAKEFFSKEFEAVLRSEGTSSLDCSLYLRTKWLF